MSLANDLSKSTIPLEQDGTVIAVIEMSQSSWLVRGIVPGLERHPRRSLSRTKTRCSACCSVGGTRR